MKSIFTCLCGMAFLLFAACSSDMNLEDGDELITDSPLEAWNGESGLPLWLGDKCGEIFCEEENLKYMLSSTLTYEAYEAYKFMHNGIPHVALKYDIFNGFYWDTPNQGVCFYTNDGRKITGEKVSNSFKKWNVMIGSNYLVTPDKTPQLPQPVLLQNGKDVGGWLQKEVDNICRTNYDEGSISAFFDVWHMEYEGKIYITIKYEYLSKDNVCLKKTLAFNEDGTKCELELKDDDLPDGKVNLSGRLWNIYINRSSWR